MIEIINLLTQILQIGLVSIIALHLILGKAKRVYFTIDYLQLIFFIFFINDRLALDLFDYICTFKMTNYVFIDEII